MTAAEVATDEDGEQRGSEEKEVALTETEIATEAIGEQPTEEEAHRPPVQVEESTSTPSAPAPGSSTEILPVPETSALNLFLDAADYLDWDLPPMEGGRHTSGSHASGEGGAGHAELSESMGAMLEAQRLMAARGGDGEGQHSSGEGTDGKQPWQEHVALLMGLQGSAGASTDGNAVASGSKRHLEDDAEGAEDNPVDIDRPNKRGRGRGGRTLGGTPRKARGRKEADLEAMEGDGSFTRRRAATSKDLLSEEQRRHNHIASEQRRRNAIKIGYSELGCLEHIDVNSEWPSSEELVDENGQIRDDPGVHIEGRLVPMPVPVKQRKKRGVPADGEDHAEENGDPPTAEVIYKKPAANKVAKGWSKNAVLQKGADLSRWLREGNEWMEQEIARLEDLLGDTEPMDAHASDVEKVLNEAASLQDHLQIDPALANAVSDQVEAA